MTWVAAGQRWHEDSWCCPECGSHLRRDELGWRCGECGFARPSTRWVLSEDSVIDDSGQIHELALSLPGRANRSNAVVALAVAATSAPTVDQALPRLREVKSVAGRYTQVQRHGRKIRLLLAKNPAGWLEAFDVLAPAPGPVLLAVNAQIPDGKDTSWLWDVDYRLLQGRPVLVSRRAAAGPGGAAGGRPGPVRARRRHRRRGRPGAGGELDVIANYTAFQQIRATLGRTD